MPLGQRLQTLRDRHAALEARVADEGTRPRPDEVELARLKREKLRLKEEMERLRVAGMAGARARA
ncbi:MAG: YdcH family protein [Acetobacteraceae bacterium]|nr:YdcH family protein [Acetobacteraceae bacterium]